VRILNRKEVEDLLTVDEAIVLMADALRRYSGGLVSQPLRTILRPEGETSLLGTMPCHVRPRDVSDADRVGTPQSADPDTSDALDTSDAVHGDDPNGALAGFGVKAMVLVPENPARGLELHRGTVLVFDRVTGAPLALMDAGAVTAVRTAAVSAVATDVLAASGANDLAVLGSGVQARAHLRAMLAVRPAIRRARVWSRTAEHAEELSSWAHAHLGLELEVCDTPAGALRGADLVCTTTAGREPIVEAADLSEGAHVNAVGSSFRDHREFSAQAVARSALFVDSRESALRESGDIGVPIEEGLIGPEHIRAELGEVLLGGHPGRTGQSEITLFKSLGLAVEDVLFGLAAARAAERRGVGTEVALD
jgi:ornithine cyclodeaminase/alanine dehydrogenase-like protein (mu-crystallin family)